MSASILHLLLLDHFYAKVSRNSEGLLGEPTLPTKRYISARLEVGAGALRYPQTAKDRFRRVCYEDIYLIVSTIDQRFDQENFSSYAQMETLRQSSSFLKHYTPKMHVDTGVLPRHATKNFGSYVKGEDITF